MPIDAEDLPRPPYWYAPTLMLEPPDPDEGEIRLVDERICHQATSSSTRLCVECGAEFPAVEPHVFVIGRVYTDDGGYRPRKAQLCDRECWLAWATTDT